VPEVRTAVGVFIGYLLLDAWIENTDRHHENWGIIVSPDTQAQPTLAPTFDHASSMGSHETDETRSARLETRDRGYSVDAYVEKADSALYATMSESTSRRHLCNFGFCAV
jgi:hypothetical protein